MVVGTRNLRYLVPVFFRLQAQPTSSKALYLRVLEGMAWNQTPQILGVWAPLDRACGITFRSWCPHGINAPSPCELKSKSEARTSDAVTASRALF